ncbi:uncharacterized protein LOC142162970 [Nicotiana tabacum]|uniref:Uncharacterized protein LOC142162970 n=1 Tax=Nicotiana tabacum TaxID=4097 RepID=A0AC58RUA1_TOBAC
MLLQITYQDKSTQTDENQESKDIFAILTTLSLQMDSMGKRLQQLESQQHDYKNAELSRSEDLKIPELEGDVGKLQKTHDKVCLPTAVGTSKQVNKKLHTNVNLNNVFDKPFTSKKPKEAIAITPQTTTYANILHHNKKVYNHITQTYIENIYKIQTFLNLNPRSTTTTDPTQDYITQKLQGYNRLIAQPKTKANLVKTCYNYGLLSTVYTHDGEEIIGIPELYKAFVTFKRITKGNLFFIKFYTAPAEIIYDEIKSIIQVIKIGLTRDMIIPEEIEKQPEIQKMEIPSFYANKRIIGIATIIQELANNYLQGNAIWSYYYRDQSEMNTIQDPPEVVREHAQLHLRMWWNDLAEDGHKWVKKQLGALINISEIKPRKDLIKALIMEELYRLQDDMESRPAARSVGVPRAGLEALTYS